MLMIESMKPEPHQSMVEVGTNVCNTPAEARAELVRLRRGRHGIGGAQRLENCRRGHASFFAAGLIRTSLRLNAIWVSNRTWQNSPSSLLIFGTHVHIGIEDLEFRVDAMNAARYMMPHVLALSTSSPFWTGRNTGLKSVPQHHLSQFSAQWLSALF